MSKNNIQDIYPLSPMQQGMLFHSLYEPTAEVYGMQLCCTLRGRLDQPAFRRAWQAMIDRHTVLRTAFVWERRPAPLQVVYRSVPELPWTELDWQHLSRAEQQAQLAALLDADHTQTFDLTRPPLMRATMIRLAEDEYSFILSHHHILLDGWSMPVLFNQLLTCYRAFSAQQPVQLPAVRPYGDYIGWLQQQDLVQAEAFWRARLKDFRQPTPLPFEKASARIPGQAEDSAEQHIVLDAALTAALQALARRYQLTLNTIMQAAWALLLSTISDEDDVVYGIVVSGRPTALPDIDSMLGLFVNTLPLRVVICREAQLSTWLQQLRDDLLELNRYEHSPLVEIQGWSEIPRGQPLFESILVFENLPTDGSLFASDGELTVERAHIVAQTNFPLTLRVIPGPGMMIQFNYDARYFDAPDIGRLLVYMQHLLESFVAQPTQRLAEISLLSATERVQQAAWNATATAYPPATSLAELFLAQAQRSPEAITLRLDDATLSYAALAADATALAHVLRAAGVGPDVPVALALDRSFDLLRGLLATLLAGGAFFPLDLTAPPARLRALLSAARPPVVLTHAARAAELRDALPTPAPRVLLLDQPLPAAPSVPVPPVQLTPDHLAYLIATSGSTGAPKPVAVAHRAIINRLQWMQATYQLTPADRVLQKTPASFDVSVWEFVWPLLTGATLVLAQPGRHTDPAYLVETIQQQQITLLHFVPAMLQLFLDDPNVTCCTSLRQVICSGEALSPELAQRCLRLLPRAALDNLYGPTEAAVDVSVWRCQPDAASVPIGRPIANTQLYVLDRALQPLPVGVAGELYIGGVQLARSYLHQPDQTAERFIPNPFERLEVRDWRLPESEPPISNLQSLISIGTRLYKTGDRARWRADGAIEYLGRTDRQIKLRGVRIELGEIEAVLRRQPGMRDAVVMVYERRADLRQLVTYVVPQPDHALTAEQLQAAVRAELPEPMVPTSYMFLDALPLSSNGKIDRRRLPEPDDYQTLQEAVAPSDPVDALLAQIWSAVLGLPQVGSQDNFFALGGHSLLATQVITRIRSTFQVELPLRSLFETRTLAELGRLIRQAQQQAAGLSVPPIVPGPAEQDQPLSYAQQRLWFLHQLEPDAAAYHMPAALRLHGALDVAALQASLSAVVARHAVLRTRFVLVDDQPVQQIDPPTSVPLPMHDLRTLPPAEREAARIAEAQAHAQQPFDLQHGSPIRAALLQLAADDWVLLLTLHHIVADGWSQGVLVRELVAHYSAARTGQPAAVPPLPVQYADYAHWQRGWMTGPVLDAQLQYWQRQLQDAPTLLALPTDRPRPPVQTYAGTTHRFQLSAELTAALHTLSRQSGATLFMTLLAAFDVLLSRWSGQTDLLVGTPIAGRTEAETEGLIGCFVNTLVLRAEVGANPSFRALLDQVRATCLAAYAHQKLPFETLVEALQPPRSRSYHPLIQVLFVLQNAPRATAELDDLRLEPLTLDTETSKFDLSLLLMDVDGVLNGALEYSTDLFDQATMLRFVEHFELLLMGIVANPDQRISELPLLTEAERALLLHTWNATQQPFPAVTQIQTLFEAQVARTPDLVAVEYADQQLTYRDLNARANQLAHHLRTLGVGADTRVGLCVDRSPALIVGVLAILKAGGCYVPLDPGYPPERLQLMLEDAQVRVLLTTKRHSEGERGRRGEGEIASIGSLPLSLVVDLVADWDQIAQEPATNLNSGARPENLAYVIYTSGSTGRPKGVSLHHSALINLLHWFLQAQLRGVRTLQFASPSFDVSFQEIFCCCCSGGTLVVTPEELRRDIEGLGRFMIEQRIQKAILPVVALQQLAALYTGQAARFRDLQELTTTGDQLLITESIVEFFKQHPDCRFHNLYGPSESHVVTAFQFDQPPDTWPQRPPIGQPIANTQMYVLDQQLDLVPIGAVGELYIGGVQLARGYLDRPDLTAERFIPNPFASRRLEIGDWELGGKMPISNLQSPISSRLYKTGDLARYLPDGNIDFLGRNDFQVKIRGFRVELDEITGVLREHPALKDAIVAAQPDATGGKRLVAYIVPAQEPRTKNQEPQSVSENGSRFSVLGSGDGSQFSIQELRAFLKDKLPDYMVPSSFVALDTLPINANGKIDRQRLPLPSEQRAEGTFEAPASLAEEVVAQIWSEVLMVQPIGRHDHFFELGGHSLLATQMISRVRKAFQVELPLRAIFEAPTVASLVEQIIELWGDPATVEEIAVLYQELAQLSEEEVQILLAKQG